MKNPAERGSDLHQYNGGCLLVTEAKRRASFRKVKHVGGEENQVFRKLAWLQGDYRARPQKAPVPIVQRRGFSSCSVRCRYS